MNKLDIWKESKYLDLWSVNHFLSGVVFTGWMLEAGLDIWIVFIIYASLAVGWEIYETIKKLHEHIGNKIMDVVTGIAGFFWSILLLF